MPYNKPNLKITYDNDGPTLKFMAWLEIDGELQTSGYTDSGNKITLRVYDEDGYEIIYKYMSSPNSRGFFHIEQNSPALVSKTGYYVVFSILHNSVLYTNVGAFYYID